MSGDFDLSGEQESTGGGGGGDFAAAPRGIYTLQVSDYAPGKTGPSAKNAGAHLTKLTLEIADEGDCFGKKVWHNLTWIPKGKPGHGILVHFLHALGLPFDGRVNIAATEREMQGKTLRALLEVDTYDKVKDGRTYTNEKNVIREVYTEAHPEPDELPPPPKPRATAPRSGNPAASHAAGQSPTGGPARSGDDLGLEEVPF